MSKYKAGDKVVLKVLSIDGDGYYIVGSEHYSWWASPINLDEVVEPLSTYTDPLNDKIKRQEEEITRLLAENAELKKKYEGLNKALNDFNDIVSESARTEGQEEAWEFTRNIALSEIYDGYSNNELEEIFGSICLDDIFNLTYTEATAKVAEWERKKEEICVGDVVKVKVNGLYAIVTHEYEECVSVVHADGQIYFGRKDGITKTGKHIDITSMLAQIGENNA